MENWKKFRPASDLELVRRRQRQIGFALGLVTALFFAILIGRALRPHVVDALTYAKAALRSPQEEVLPLIGATHSGKPRQRPPRKLHNLAPQRFNRKRELGPFDAYILTGDGYIRIEGMSQYALLDTRTGEVIWIKEPQ